MNAIQAKLPCECGGSVVATAGDAGGFVNCHCGRSVAIPNLSRLRVLSGKDAYVTNPVEAIRKAQRDGVRPGGEACLICGSSSPIQYQCEAICESTHMKKGDEVDTSNFFQMLIYFLLFGWLTAFVLARGRNPNYAEVRGHDVRVDFNLPVCDICTASNGSPARKKVARRLMQTVPVYKELLMHYPDLTLKVQRIA